MVAGASPHSFVFSYPAGACPRARRRRAQDATGAHKGNPMSERDARKILIILDSDTQVSSFDQVVAVDAGVDAIFAYANVTPEQVESLVHGAIFTRSPRDLHRTGIFIGGSDVVAGERILDRVVASFLPPLSVSVMLDANGANTTAAAAVLAAGRHLDLSATTALVLGGTGPVGQRSARLLAREGAAVRLASRSRQRAGDAARHINDVLGSDRVTPCVSTGADAMAAALEGAALVIAAGAAGVELLSAAALRDAPSVRVAIDLNAVPPLGVEGVKVTDKAADAGPLKVYGAIGTGGTKMKIHKAAIATLFRRNDEALDAEQIYALGREL